MALSDLPQRWEIAILPFPYVDRLAEKRRPALIVSHNWLHRDYGLAWVVMITSAENQRWKCDIDITNLKQTGLPIPSVVRPIKIATIESDRIVRIAGRLAKTDRTRIEQTLAQLCGS
jgi:mRNA interferase MazF